MGFGFTKPIFMLIKKAIARRGYLILTSGRTANQRIAFISSFFFKYSSSNLAFVYTGYNALYTDFCYYNLERVNPYLKVYLNVARKWDTPFTHTSTSICMKLIHAFIHKMHNSNSNNTFSFSFSKTPKESQFQIVSSHINSNLVLFCTCAIATQCYQR